MDDIIIISLNYWLQNAWYTVTCTTMFYQHKQANGFGYGYYTMTQYYCTEVDYYLILIPNGIKYY